MKLLSRLLALALYSLSAAGADHTAYRFLQSTAVPEKWAPAECEVTLSEKATREFTAVEMHIPVDYSTGEPKHLIGWPRMYLDLPKDEKDWSTFDFLELRIFSESSFGKLPGKPLFLHLYGNKGKRVHRPLEELEVGKWKTIRVNLAEADMDRVVNRVGFNINESDYPDKSKITFHIGAFRLSYSTVVKILNLNIVAPAVFNDSPVLPVEVIATGPADQLAAGVPFSLRKDDKTELIKSFALTKGKQTIYLPLPKPHLEPGAYTLHITPGDNLPEASCNITLSSSPWLPD